MLVLNDSVVQVLEENCGVGKHTKSINRKHRKKIIPGEQIVDMDNQEPCRSRSSKKKKKDHQSRQKQLIRMTSLKMKRRNRDVMAMKKSWMKMEMIDGLFAVYAVLNFIFSVHEPATMLNSIGIVI